LVSFCAALSIAQNLSAEAIPVSALEHLPLADVYVLGELHDQKHHHDNQARAVASIQPKALVLEMLTPEQAAAGKGVARDDMDALETALGWAETSWPDFEMYFPIFEASDGAAIYGAALPRDVVRAAVSDGAAQHFDGEAARFGLEEALHPDEQAQRERLQARAHCDALPPDLLPGMVAAQRLRDASFAKTALDALAETGGPVVVITGNGHARRDWGIPGYIQRAAPDVSVLSIGQIAGDETFPQFDKWIISEITAPETDPCAAFQSN